MKRTETKFEKVIEHILNGKNLRESLRIEQLGNSTFYNLIGGSKAKQEQYARACEIRYDEEFEEIKKIADEVKAEISEIAKARIQIEARKWRLSKLLPKKYGNRVEVEPNTSGKVSISIDLGLDSELPD